jgi:hypothetical protein
MAESATIATPKRSSFPVFLQRYIYVFLGIVALVIVHIGFARTYINPVINGAFTGRKILHIHGAIFMTWIILCIAQPFLIQKKKIQLHRKIGIYGFVLGGLVTLMGLYIAVSSAHANLARDGEQAVRATLLIPITDMILFSLFITLAICAVKKPEWHKRYIVLATLSILPAATGRMLSHFTWWTGNVFVDAILALLIMEMTLYIAIVSDLLVHKKIHSVYIWGGLLVLSIHAFRGWASNTEAWLEISNWIPI